MLQHQHCQRIVRREESSCKIILALPLPPTSYASLRKKTREGVSIFTPNWNLFKPLNGARVHIVHGKLCLLRGREGGVTRVLSLWTSFSSAIVAESVGGGGATCPPSIEHERSVSHTKSTVKYWPRNIQRVIRALIALYATPLIDVALFAACIISLFLYVVANFFFFFRTKSRIAFVSKRNREISVWDRSGVS